MRHLASHLALFFVVAAAACPSEEAPEPVVDDKPSAAADPHAGHAMPAPGAAPQTPAATSAQSVFFVWPHDGSTVFADFDVAFGVNGIGLRKAGEDPLDKTTGHHHLIIDSPSIPAGQVVPKNDKYLHFGKAETETTLTLAAGPHTLTLQLADGGHFSYGPSMSKTIKVTVK